jgi:hypothetical protein
MDPRAEVVAGCSAETPPNHRAQGISRARGSVAGMNRFRSQALRGDSSEVLTLSSTQRDLGGTVACPRRRECLLQLLNDELEEPRRSVDVLEPVFP